MITHPEEDAENGRTENLRFKSKQQIHPEEQQAKKGSKSKQTKN